MSTKIQNYLNLYLFQKEQILGCYKNFGSEKHRPLHELYFIQSGNDDMNT